MIKVLTFIFITLAIFSVIYSISTALYYKYLYFNLHNNFKTFMTEVDRKYARVDVILHNAILEALDQAKEKDNQFEVRAYTDLLERLKGKW